MWQGGFAACILFLLSTIHFYWLLGGSQGLSGVVPEMEGKKLFVPGKSATLLVAVLLLFAALTVLGRVGLWGSSLPQWIFLWGTHLIASAFLLRVIGDFRYVGLFKKMRGTRFAYWDTRLFVPLCALIAVCTFSAAN